MSSEEIEYYRITKDWQVISGDSPETVKSKATLYWIRIQESDYRTHTTRYGNTYKLNDYDILDKKLKPTTIQKSSFSITRIYHKHKSMGLFDVTFKNEFGEARDVHQSPWTNALDFLEELDEFHSWIEYDLNKENAILESKVDDLEDQTKNLEADVSSLKDQIKKLKKRKRTTRKPKK